jgi:hypothetical protein
MMVPTKVGYRVARLAMYAKGSQPLGGWDLKEGKALEERENTWDA